MANQVLKKIGTLKGRPTFEGANFLQDLVGHGDGIGARTFGNAQRDGGLFIGQCALRRTRSKNTYWFGSSAPSTMVATSRR